MNITGPCTDKENIYGCILGRERINQGYSCETCVSAFFRRPRLKSILLLPCQIFRGEITGSGYLIPDIGPGVREQSPGQDVGPDSYRDWMLGRAHQKLRK